jgi:hypothetical protein
MSNSKLRELDEQHGPLGDARFAATADAPALIAAQAIEGNQRCLRHRKIDANDSQQTFSNTQLSTKFNPLAQLFAAHRRGQPWYEIPATGDREVETRVLEQRTGRLV